MNGFKYVFPAIKGIQAARDFYVAMCPLSMLPKLFQLPDDDLLPEFRAQRVLNRTRIPAIARYITQNPHDYVFSSLAASVDGDMEFLSDTTNPSLGTLSISMDAHILINDGQHRRAAIEEALASRPELANETISVVFFHDAGLRRCQQMFADLNKHAINTSKSLGILYDSRDPFSNVVRDLTEKIPLLRDYTRKDSDNLSKLAPQIFTLTNVSNSVERILGKQRNQSISEEDAAFVLEYWKLLSSTFIEWKDVQNKRLKASDLRLNYVHAHGVVLDALGLLGHYFYTNHIPNMKKYIAKLNKINWKRSNLEDWAWRSIDKNGKILRFGSSAQLCYIHIKRLIGLDLSDSDLNYEKTYFMLEEKVDK